MSSASKPAGQKSQKGGFVLGLIVGLLVGLAVALGVALYITKVPIPFINKVPQRTAEQDAAEAERNRNWDPNSALAGRNPAPGTSASGVVTGTEPPVRPAVAPAIEPPAPAVSASLPRTARAAASGAAPRASQATAALTSGAFTYFVQAGAYSRSEDAEQQRAKLAMLGLDSRLTEREQGGKMVYRVRVGPFDRREDAESTKEKLTDSGVDAALVAVQK
jgi:cell division protein FtsN